MPELPYAAEIAKLKARNPSGNQRRWEQAKHDAEAFLAQWGAEAERLGWPARDLFGLDAFAPLARYSEMGLLWILQGREVQEVTAEHMQLGNTRFYRRHENDLPASAS